MKNKKLTESKVIIENGEVKTIFSEEIQKTGYMTVEESKELMLQYFTKIKELNQQNASQNK
jgi:hypothetical protein